MKTKNLLIIALFAAITSVCSLISIPLPFSPVPLSLSILAVFLSGIALDKKSAAFTQVVYLMIGAVGVPVFSNFGAGFAKLAGPTGGYLFAYPLMAFIIAYIIEKSGKRNAFIYFFSMLVSLIMCYILGTIWLSMVANISFSKALFAGVIPFIPLDLVKMAITAPLGTVIYKSIKYVVK